MINSGISPQLPRGTSFASLRLTANWLPVFLMLALVFAATPVHAVVSLDDQYLAIVRVIEEGDVALARTNNAVAKAKYEAANKSLLELKRNYANWNTKAVAFRLRYVSEKLAAMAPARSTPQAEAAPITATDARPQAKAALPAGVQVRLISAGSEPRNPVRFKPKADEKQTVVLSMAVSHGMGPAESPPQMMKLPTMKMNVSVVTKAVSSEGDIDYEVTVDEVTAEGAVGVEPQATEAVKETLKGVKGLRVLCTVTDRGINKKSEPHFPADANPQTKLLMEQITEGFSGNQLLLPHEPVGAGAKWEIRQKLSSQGMTIDQTATHTLASVAGDSLEIKSATIQTAANQTVPNPMAPGTTATLVKLSGTSAATMKMDLTKLMPTMGMTEEHSATTLAMEVGGQKQNLMIKSDTVVGVESK